MSPVAGQPSSMTGNVLSAPRIEQVALLAAGALVGFGLILFIAANWEALGRFGRFALVGGAVLLAAVGSAAFPRLRGPLALTGILAIGGLLALVGQTYQSSADAWTLFAAWALLALPWTIAARLDAAWVLWVAVAFTGIELWMLTTSPSAVPPIAERALGWLVAGGIIAALHPGVGIARFVGPTRWAFRLGVLLFVALVVGNTLFLAVSSWAAYLGIAVLALLLLALAEVDPFDGPLLVAAVIGFDVLLLSQLLANLYPYFDDAFGALLVSGLAVAAVFGVSLRVMRAVAERRGARLVATGSVKAALPEWPMTVLSVFGAQLAALPFLALLFLLFAPVLDSAGAYPMAVALMGAGVAGMKAFGERSFLNQQALTVLAVGIALLAVAAFRDVSLGQASLLVLLVVSLLATVVRPPWVAAMLGAMAAGLAVLCVGSQLASEPKDWLVGGYREQAFLIVTAVTAVALLLAAAARRQVPDRPLDIARLDHFTTGAAALLLLAVLAGNPTFLLSADPAGGLLSASVPLEWALTPSRAIAIVMVAAAGLWLKFRTAILDRTAAMGIGAATMALTYVMPILAVAVVLYAAARASSRRTLAVFAAVAGLWLMGSFYYWLGWPLMDKAQFLMLLGLGLGGLAYALDARLPAALTTGGQRDTLGVGARGLANRLGVPLILLSIVATALIVGRAVQDNESILANGRRILVALAPVDPRSLMQGDYMILRMRLPETPVALPVEALRFALADVAADDVATVIALSPERPVAGPTQVVIAIHAERGQTVMGTTSYFFREGTAKRFAEARFAEFRLAPDGRPLLTALADADKRIIATD